MRHSNSKFALALALAAVTGLSACASSSQRSGTPPGNIGAMEETQGNAADGSIDLQATTDVLPVGSRHILVATVYDDEGRPVAGEPVEWTLVMGSVGAISEHDCEGDCANRLCGFCSITYTGSGDRLLDMGTPSPDDDVVIGPGQTYIAVVSPMEGSAHVMASARGVENWDNRHSNKMLQWRDVRIAVSPDATGRTGGSHTITVQAQRHSDSMPLVDHIVKFRVLNGPAAIFDPENEDSVSKATDANGVASTTLKQVTPIEGSNDVEIQVIRPANEECCEPELLLATVVRTYTWVSPSVNIIKTAPEIAQAGQPFDYDIVVGNDSDIEALDAMVSDELPAGIEYISSAPPAQVDGQALSWSLGNLGAGEERVLRVTVRATETGRFTNCAQVAAEGGNLTAEDCATTVVTAPDVELVKTAPAAALTCDPIPLTFMVRNNGDAPATNVRIEDQLPEGMVAADGSSSLTFLVGDLGPGETREFNANVTAEGSGTYDNTAVATADGGIRVESSTSTTVTQPMLEITKAATGSVGDRGWVYGTQGGALVTYEITVSNTGDGVAQGTVVRDRLLAGMRFESADNGGRVVDGDVIWDLGDLQPGDTRTVSMNVRLMDTPLGNRRNTAFVEAFCAGSQTAAFDIDVRGIPAILLEMVDLIDPVPVGDTTTYEIKVFNQGSIQGTNVRVQAIIPDEMDYVAADGPTTATVEGKSVVFAPLATLAPRAEAIYRITVSAVSQGDVRFRVLMKSAQDEKDVEETESTFIYE